MKKAIIYTDGSCKQSSGYGGWGSILFFQGYKKKIYGNYKITTNNQMELIAIINSLQYLKFPCEVKIITDSKYVKDGINNWIFLWRKNNSIYIEKEKKNKNLWKKLYNICNKKKHIINWFWIKGHHINQYNIKVDYISKRVIKDGSQNIFRY